MVREGVGKRWRTVTGMGMEVKAKPVCEPISATHKNEGAKVGGAITVRCRRHLIH